MKKVCLILLLLCLVATPALAKSRRYKTKDVAVKQEAGHSVLGVKIDAPNLVNIDDEGEWTLGAEAGKDIFKNIFHNDSAYYEADKGYFAYVKVTYKGCLLNCKED